MRYQNLLALGLVHKSLQQTIATPERNSSVEYSRIQGCSCPEERPACRVSSPRSEVPYWPLSMAGASILGQNGVPEYSPTPLTVNSNPEIKEQEISTKPKTKTTEGSARREIKPHDDGRQVSEMMDTHGKPLQMVKIGPWGDTSGTPRDILYGGFKPRYLQTIMVRSSEIYGGRINGLFFIYEDQRGQSIPVGYWGSNDKGYEHTITMGSGEHVNYVSGTADKTGVRSLTLGTNKGVKRTYGCPTGTAFSVPLQEGGEVLGFFGHADSCLAALGVYVASRDAAWTTMEIRSVVKIGLWGGTSGTFRDIRFPIKSRYLETIMVRRTELYGGRINGFYFVYVDYWGQSIPVGYWGTDKTGYEDTITMGSGEHVNYMSGTTDETGVRSLMFRTNKGVRRSYGYPIGMPFSVPLQESGEVLGFFGRADSCLVALGAYVASRDAACA